jgi:hypothetical protein
MTMQINPYTKITLLDPDFVQAINNILESSSDTSNGVVLNFRDPTYSATAGGFHPVEIAIDGDGDLTYLTDFSYVGIPPYTELEKELDWDFLQGRFSQFGCDYDLECGRGLLNLYLKNVTAYSKSGYFEVEVTSI